MLILVQLEIRSNVVEGFFTDLKIFKKNWGKLLNIEKNKLIVEHVCGAQWKAIIWVHECLIGQWINKLMIKYSNSVV